MVVVSEAWLQAGRARHPLAITHGCAALPRRGSTPSIRHALMPAPAHLREEPRLRINNILGDPL